MSYIALSGAVGAASFGARLRSSSRRRVRVVSRVAVQRHVAVRSVSSGLHPARLLRPASLPNNSLEPTLRTPATSLRVGSWRGSTQALGHSMTIRQYLRRRVVFATAVALAAGLLLFSVKFLGNRMPAAVVVACILAFVASALIVNFGIRCLVCRGNLAFLFAGLFNSGASLGERRFVPYLRDRFARFVGGAGPTSCCTRPR